MRLSDHFTLAEFKVSRRFPDLAAGIEFSLHDQHKCFLLARTLLEPLRRELGGPVFITSGKRTPELNRALGGAPASDHLFQGFGAAVDFTLPLKVRDRLALVPELVRPAAFGQLILYLEADQKSPRFVHLSLPTWKHHGERWTWVRGQAHPRRAEAGR